MNARLEQRFIGVYVSHAAQEFLIQQQRLDSRMAFFQQLQEILERDVKGVGSQRAGPFRQTCAPLDPAEMADVVVDQESLIELKDRTGVGGRFGIEQQLAGHSEVNRQ